MAVKSIFSKIDSQTWNFCGFNPFAVFWNIRSWRRIIIFYVCLSLFAWVVFGWEATWSQTQPFVANLLPLLNGKIALGEVWQMSQTYYGTGNHFSAPVIYGIAFVMLSLHLEKAGIKKSLNFFSSSCLSLMNIGIFEIAYNLLYAPLQNQAWTIQFQWRQIWNLTFFLLFIVVGVLAFIYLWSFNLRPNFSKVTMTLFALASFMWLLWIFYPFPVETITVETTAGTWESQLLFPQTMYAVDLNPLDELATGMPYFVKNDLLHAVNVFCKVFSTVAILSLCMVKNQSSLKYNFHFN